MGTPEETDWKRKAGELRQSVLELRTRAERLRRTVLEKDVLHRSLPLRAGTAAARSSRPEVRDRERRFAAASATYADTIGQDEADIGGHARRITLDTLAWWVPLMRPDDPVQVERAIGHQDFPYRVIAQTRELALGGIMLDLGANVGRMSVPRVILGDVAAAFCAEPDPLNYECLVRNVRDNELRGLVLPDRVAIGGSTGSVRFARTRTAGGHRVIADSVETRHETIEVPMVTLDEWVGRHDIDPALVTFVKVDVQGSEVGVLRGAARVLAYRHIAWQMELDPLLLHRAGTPIEELFALVQRHFTHFIDLNREASGHRVRDVSELPEALAYVTGERDGRTDVLLCTLAASPAGS